MSNTPANRSDTRRRYTHQAFDVTTFGKPLETAPSGYGRRLSGTYQAAILLNIPATGGEFTLGDLTAGLWGFQVVNHVALSTGTLRLRLPAFGGQGQQDLTTALALNAAGVSTMAAPIWAPLPIDRPLTGLVSTGTGGQTAVVSLLLTPAENSWF
jgi:hypothetical protein